MTRKINQSFFLNISQQLCVSMTFQIKQSVLTCAYDAYYMFYVLDGRGKRCSTCDF